MVTVEDYDELIDLARAAKNSMRKKENVKTGKASVEGPDGDDYEITIKTANKTAIDAKAITDEDALKAKFVEMFP